MDEWIWASCVQRVHNTTITIDFKSYKVYPHSCFDPVTLLLLLDDRTNWEIGWDLKVEKVCPTNKITWIEHFFWRSSATQMKFTGVSIVQAKQVWNVIEGPFVGKQYSLQIGIIIPLLWIILVQWSEKVAPGPWLRSVGISEFFFVRALQENYLWHLFHLCRIVPIKIEFVGILLRGSPIPIYENLILASFEQQRFLFLLLVEQQLPVEGRHWGVRHWGEGGLHNAPHLRRLCSRLAWDVMQVMILPWEEEQGSLLWYGTWMTWWTWTRGPQVKFALQSVKKESYGLLPSGARWR